MRPEDAVIVLPMSYQYWKYVPLQASSNMVLTLDIQVIIKFFGKTVNAHVVNSIVEFI